MKQIVILLIIFFSYNLIYSQNSNEPLCAYMKDSVWHFIDYNNQELFTPKKILDVGGFSENMFRVKLNEEKNPKNNRIKEQWGFLDSNGDLVIKTNCDLVLDFSCGLAQTINVVDDKGELTKNGFIDKTGKQVIPMIYDDAISFTEGMAYVMNDSLRGYIDTTGRWIFQFDSLVGYNFSEGIAALSNFDYKVAYYDKFGNRITGFKFDTPSGFSDGYADVGVNGLYGYINNKGLFVIKPTFKFARKFSENRAFVAIFIDQTTVKWGMIDKSGKLILDYNLDYITEFSEGLAAVSKDGITGYIDSTGNYKIERKFYLAHSFKNGLAMAVSQDKTICGFINKNGEWVIKLPLPDKIIDLRFNKKF